MKVELLKEHEDGSATFRIDMTDEEKTGLLCLGIVAGLEQGIKNAQQYIGEDIEQG